MLLNCEIKLNIDPFAQGGNSISFISSLLISLLKLRLLIFKNISGKLKNSGINSRTSSFNVMAISKVFCMEVNNLSLSSNFSP